MGRYVCPVLDSLAVLVVEFVGAEQHFFVGLCWLEPELTLDLGCVKNEGAGNHFILVGAKRRDAQLACELHTGDDKPLGEVGQLGFGFSVFNDVAVYFVEGFDVV